MVKILLLDRMVMEIQKVNGFNSFIEQTETRFGAKNNYMSLLTYLKQLGDVFVSPTATDALGTFYSQNPGLLVVNISSARGNMRNYREGKQDFPGLDFIIHIEEELLDRTTKVLTFGKVDSNTVSRYLKPQTPYLEMPFGIDQFRETLGQLGYQA